MRLRLRMAAEEEPGQGVFGERHLRERPRPPDEDAVDRRAEPGRHVAEREDRLRGPGESRNARGAGALGNRNGGVLASPWRRPEEDPDGSVPAAGRVLHGEERLDYQTRRAGATGPPGGPSRAA